MPWKATFLGNVAGGTHRIVLVNRDDTVYRRLVTVPVAGPLGLISPMLVTSYEISESSIHSEIQLANDLTACHEATLSEDGASALVAFT